MCNDHSNDDYNRDEENGYFSFEDNYGDDDNNDKCKKIEFICVLMRISISNSSR
jgi:hypothetical protein